MKKIILCGFLVSLSAVFFAHAKTDDVEKIVYGRYEWVRIPELSNIKYKAKLDTGALTSSLGAKNIQYFTKDDDKWVKFELLDDDSDKAFSFPLKRVSKIKKRVGDIEEDSDLLTERPVILLKVCMGNKIKKIEVNLSDRSNFNYPFLMGAKGLVKFNALVDAGAKFQNKLKCK